MRPNFEQKNRLVWRTSADLRYNSLDGVTSRQSDLQAVWRAVIAVRIHDTLSFTQTNDIRSVYCLFHRMERLALTDLRTYIGLRSMKILFDFRGRIELALRNLLHCEAIVRRRGDVLGHALRKEGLLLGIFCQIILI